MDYLQLITSEYKNQPKFTAWLSAALGMIQDVQNFLLTMQNSFDLDRAVGKQLDTIGEVLNMPRLLPFQPNEIYSLQVNGATTETGTGEKAPDNPFTLVGTQSITVSGDPSQSETYAINPPAYGITPDVCDTVDVVTGQRTSDVEIKTLDGTGPWQYDEQSLNTATGNGISVVDSQDGGEFTSLAVTGMLATNSVTITGGTDTQNITLPQTLYSLPNNTSDVYNIISGQGTQRINSLTLDGSESWVKASASTSIIGVFALTVNDAALTGEDGAVISTRFNHSAQSGTYTPIANSISLTTDAHQIRIATDVTTDLAAFKTWLSTNNDTVLYELASAQTIEGTPQTVQTYSSTSVTSDGEGNISATYINNSPVLYVHCSYPLIMIGHCTHFKDQVYDSEWYDGEQGIGYVEDTIRLKIPKSLSKTILELKTWISSQTVQFVSQRASPVVTQGTGQPITVYSPATTVYRDDGTLIGTYDIFSSVMTDEIYRTALKAVVADTHFTGTPESLYSVLQNSLGNTGLYFSVVDNQNMSMSVVAFGATNPAIQSLIQRGMIVPRPEGVKMSAAVSTNKVFGWDAESNVFGGWDEGYWLP